MEKNFSKDSKITVILMVIISTSAYEIFMYIYKIASLSSSAEALSFIKILLIELLFNILLTIIIYPLMQKFGIKIESIFKKMQMISGYF